jgi:glycoprotein 3-alpha-L-fucosyltransferase
MNGTERPSMPKKKWRLALWPEESPNSDRILNQLMYLPKNYEQIKKSQTLKKILLYFGSKKFGVVNGQQKFLDDNCPVNTCTITVNKSEAQVVDAIIFENKFETPKHKRDLNQVWILYMLESPLNTQWVSNYNYDVINWTATYRLDSDIVTPYEKFVSYNNDFLMIKSDNKVRDNLIFENFIFYQILI